MKKFLTLTIASIFILCSCSTSMSQTDKYLQEWYENANLNAIETAEELYEKALEEDVLIIYSTTTRLYDVKDSFEKEYPGLSVEIYDTRAYDIVESLNTAYENDEFFCDIVVCSNDTGELSTNLMPKYIINKYVPYDIEPLLTETANGELLDFVGEAEQLFYNDQAYDTCPIENWWELTEPEWYGKVYMNSPLRSYPAFALVYGVINNPEKMEQAYFDLYGAELEIPDGSSAGEIFWEKLVANGIGFTTSSNELVELVGTDTTENSPLAFMVSSKIRRYDLGLSVAPAYGIAPCDGVYSSNSISIAGGAQNISSAKLFVRWLLGEADGTGEGLAPYTLDGTWPARTDVDTLAQINQEDANFWYNDYHNVYEKQAEIEKFWFEIQGN